MLIFALRTCSSCLCSSGGCFRVRYTTNSSRCSRDVSMMTPLHCSSSTLALMYITFGRPSFSAISLINSFFWTCNFQYSECLYSDKNVQTISSFLLRLLYLFATDTPLQLPNSKLSTKYSVPAAMLCIVLFLALDMVN